jgi:excisionase family DNA binding protein
MGRRLTVEQAIEEFFQNNIGKSTLYEMVRKNDIPHVRLTKGKILFDLDRLESWWKERLEECSHKKHTNEEADTFEIRPVGYGTLRKLMP